jgi:hypothetical protein
VYTGLRQPSGLTLQPRRLRSEPPNGARSALTWWSGLGSLLPPCCSDYVRDRFEQRGRDHTEQQQNRRCHTHSRKKAPRVVLNPGGAAVNSGADVGEHLDYRIRQILI